MSDETAATVPPGLIERVLDAVGDAVFATWPDGTIFLWNRRATELFGWAKSEAVGKNLLSLTPGSKLASEAQEMLETLQGGQRWEGEVQFRRAEGSTFPGRVSAAPVMDEDDRLEAISFLAHDRTEELRQQERLAEHARQVEHRNEQLRSLAVAAAHNFQEPVRDVVAHTQRIEAMLADLTQPELEDAFETVREGALRMRDLARGLNRYAELAEHEPEIETVDLGQIVEDARETYQDLIDETQATVTVGDLPTVLSDPEDLTAVFEALLENALDFRSDEPPRIEISASRRDDTWIVSVSDNGIGIDPDMHERIFRPFQRAHSYDERAGIGLGLTIAREFVEACGGNLWVDSELGEGATFYVALPAPGDEPIPGVSVGERAPSTVPASEASSDVFADAS